LVSEKLAIDADEMWVKVIKPVLKTLRSTGNLQKQFLDPGLSKKIMKRLK
jgi:hypothetical protein